MKNVLLISLLLLGSTSFAMGRKLPAEKAEVAPADPTLVGVCTKRAKIYIPGKTLLYTLGENCEILQTNRTEPRQYYTMSGVYYGYKKQYSSYGVKQCQHGNYYIVDDYYYTYVKVQQATVLECED